MRKLFFAWPSWVFAVASIAAVASSSGQDSAPSSHLVFDDSFPGDLLIHDVRVPADGETLYTYYETLGWRGKAAGYAGIQSHPRGRNFIFSIWDHPEHRAPIRPVHRGAGTKTEPFGGEGTGLKSWNFELGWQTDTWYTLVARCWPVEDHTFFGFWARDGRSGQWTHLVTMDVAVADARFRGGTDAFIEDWLSTGENRRSVHFRNGWKRKLDGNWYAFQSARYSVNAWDLEEGKRSFNYRDHWNGGVKQDESESFYFMTSGGKSTRPAVKNPSTHRLERKQQRPEFGMPRIKSLEAKLEEPGKVVIGWELEPTSTPQFAYRALLVDADGKPIDGVGLDARIVPHQRTENLSVTDAPPIENLKVRLEVVDLFGNRSDSLTVPIVTGH